MRRVLNIACAAIVLGLAFPVAADPIDDAVAARLSGDYPRALKLLRPLADQGNAAAQSNLGFMYATGMGLPQDRAEAAKWYRRAAEQGRANAQYNLGRMYATGQGVDQDSTLALRWFSMAAEQGEPLAQAKLGLHYSIGDGVQEDASEAAKWYRKSAEQGFASAQFSLGYCYLQGRGVLRDNVEAHKWFNLASAQGDKQANAIVADIELRMTRDQIGAAQRLAKEFRPQRSPQPDATASLGLLASWGTSSSGTGFFITEDGYFVTNQHVVSGAVQVRLVSTSGMIAAKLVKIDAANDIV
jgi:hypothetical protein